MNHSTMKIALLIDADNMSVKKIDYVFSKLKTLGKFQRIADSEPLRLTDNSKIICYSGKRYDICYKQ